MKKLRVRLRHCYGIKRLDAEFDLGKNRAHAIYAANGSMKSSLAATFKDVADAKASQDRIFPDRTTIREIVDENGQPLKSDSILVLRPYDEFFGQNEKTSTLLVEPKLRVQYEKLHATIDEATKIFLKALKKQSRSKRDIASEISQAFMAVPDELHNALIRVSSEVEVMQPSPLADVPYDTIFDDKVLAFLASHDFKTAIEQYVKKYNELLDSSTYFRRDTFNYYNASKVADTLADNGFFDARHSISLNAGSKKEITSKAELEDLVRQEKEAITKDKDLQRKFAEIEKQINKNASMRDFERYVAEHVDILPKLSNIDKLKHDVWKAYFRANRDLYNDLIEQCKATEKAKRAIELAASEQVTQWQQVIDIFNQRFFVPFTLHAKNKVGAVLGQEMLQLGFTFEDAGEKKEIDRDSLLQSLSQGEKKALYILSIIFEVEVRRKTKQLTVFVVDDIADSFDYRNKYAIVHYLKEIARDDHFYQILLTHNFDFFRTVSGRYVGQGNCRMAVKSDEGVTLAPADGIRNIFVNVWKKHFVTDSRKRVACIPFMRNLIEYIHGEGHPAFELLTSLLHAKPASEKVTEKDLVDVYNDLFGTAHRAEKPGDLVVNTITAQAVECLSATDGPNLENKIVLSIAVRLASEKYMVKKLAMSSEFESIGANQTAVLIEKFREKLPTEHDALEVLQRVELMTPENIHLNSFMYEPILDMSDRHLRALLEDVLRLDATG